MKYISLVLAIALAFSTETIVTVPSDQIKELELSKKSLNSTVNSFIKCFKGSQDCSTQKTKILRATLTLIGLIGLISIGATTAYVLYKKGKLPQELITAAAHGDLDTIINRVNSSNINATDANGNTMLHIAAHNAHDKVIAELTNRDAQQITNKAGKTPLSVALEWQKILLNKNFGPTISLLSAY